MLGEVVRIKCDPSNAQQDYFDKAAVSICV